MNSNRRTIFLSAISGNILEYYDFTVYVVFSTAIAKAFFPVDSEVTQLLLSLCVFAVGFITRPIGGIIFGNIADKHGRRVALIISMLGMTIPTFTMGVIPDYSDIGLFAPIILVLMRLIQGLCISGEGAGAAIFILEHYENLRPGFTSGVVHASNIAGTLFATIVGILLGHYFHESDFAWRFAFILGGLMGIAGFYYRLRVSETPIFVMLSEKKETLKVPFRNILKTAKIPMIITCSLGACASSVVYLIKAYISIYFSNVMHYNPEISRMFLAYSTIILMFIMPLSGHLSDKYGRFVVITTSALSIFIFAIPAFILLSSNIAWKQLFALTMISTMGGMIAGSAYIFIISLFSPNQRFSGVAFSYNLGIALCGGTSAAISRSLVEITSMHYAPAFFIMATSGVFLIITYFMRKIIRRLLNIHLKRQR